MEETINAFINHNFDDFEFALMACMVLVSPDRGGTINIAEHRALGTIQECLAAILETKLHKDGKDIKYFSSCLYLLTRLRSFSELLQPMWETILDSRQNYIFLYRREYTDRLKMILDNLVDPKWLEI